MDHALEAGEVVRGPRLFRQGQQTDEHGRHHVHVAKAQPLDIRQQAGGIETRQQVDITAHPVEKPHIGHGRGVIERPGDRAHDPWPDAEARGGHGQRVLLLLGRGRLAPDPLRPPGGAGGVDHAAARDALLGRPSAVRRDPVVPPRPPLGVRRILVGQVVSPSDFRRRLDQHDFDAGRHHFADPWPEVGVHKHHLGPAIGQDVAGFLRREMPVDRHGIGADQARRLGGRDERQVVPQAERDRVSLLDAGRRHGRGRAPGLDLQLGQRRPPARRSSRSVASTENSPRPKPSAPCPRSSCGACGAFGGWRRRGCRGAGRRGCPRARDRQRAIRGGR